MRKCIVSKESKEYNEDLEFASYTIQKRNGSRFILLQFVRGRGDEQFALIELVLHQKGGNGGRMFGSNESEYKPSYNIVMEDYVKTLIAEEGTAYALNIVNKQYLEQALSSFEAASIIRANNLVQALNILCSPVKKLTGIEINPIELILLTTEVIAVKKVEGRCTLS